MRDYEDYDRSCQSIREENAKLLDDFESWLIRKNLTETTAIRHCRNIDFYINEFLLYEGPRRPADGVNDVGLFLGYWFIRKAMWANQTSIKANAASLKKFYDFMAERGEVDRSHVNAMKGKIKNELPEWLATMRRYDDPSIDMEDVWPW